MLHPVSRAGVAATIAALLAVIAGLMILGTPSHARERRLDELRVADLARVSQSVDEHWAKHGALPLTLDSLVSQQQLDRVPTDPWGHPYQYQHPGQHGDVDVYSFGADGKAGGEGEAADIGNWDS